MALNRGSVTSLRRDHALIARMVAEGARVLDIGSGDGSLLEHLEATRGVDGRGIEIAQSKVKQSLKKGLSVIQGNADEDLDTYPDQSFDVVILSQTLQAMQQPQAVVQHMLRIGRVGIVSFPNFGHWRVRLSLLFSGRMPMTDELPVPWYDTPNIHLCTVLDFLHLMREMDIDVMEVAALNRSGVLSSANLGLGSGFSFGLWRKNLFAEEAIFKIQRKP